MAGLCARKPIKMANEIVRPETHRPIDKGSKLISKDYGWAWNFIKSTDTEIVVFKCPFRNCSIYCDIRGLRVGGYNSSSLGQISATAKWCFPG